MGSFDVYRRVLAATPGDPVLRAVEVLPLPDLSFHRPARDSQEWPRQTKPEKGRFMNFSQGHSGTEAQCESCFFHKVAIVRACYTMDNGPNDKNRKKMGKSWKICPDRKWGKNGRKIPKKWKIGPIFHFFCIFRPFFPHFRSGQIFHDFPIFFLFLSFGPFSIV